MSAVPSHEPARIPHGMRPAKAREIADNVRRTVLNDPKSALAAAQREYRIFREEKALAGLHRHRAQRKKFLFDEFKHNLEALGIEVIIEQPNPNHQRPRGGASERSNRARSDSP